MKPKLFTSFTATIGLALCCLGINLIAMEMPPKEEKEYSITNNSGQDLHVRVRIADRVYLPNPMKYDYDILENSEAFKLRQGQTLFLPLNELAFPANIRFWPATYTPEQAQTEKGQNKPTSDNDVNNSIALITAASLNDLTKQVGKNGNLQLLAGPTNRLMTQITDKKPFYETSKNIPLFKPAQKPFTPQLPSVPIKPKPAQKPVAPEIPAIVPLIKPVAKPSTSELAAPYVVVPKLGPQERPDIQPNILNIRQANALQEQERKQLTQQNGYLTENLQIDEYISYTPTGIKQNDRRYTLLRNSFGPLYARIELGNYVFKPLGYTFDNSHNVFLFEKGKDLLIDSNLLSKYAPFKIYLWPKDSLDFINKDVDITGKPAPTSAENKSFAIGIQEANARNQLRGKYNAYDLVNEHGILLFKELDI